MGRGGQLVSATSRRLETGEGAHLGDEEHAETEEGGGEELDGDGELPAEGQGETATSAAALCAGAASAATHHWNLLEGRVASRP